MKFQLLNEDKGFLFDLTGNEKFFKEPVLLIIVG